MLLRQLCRLLCVLSQTLYSEAIVQPGNLVPSPHWTPPSNPPPQPPDGLCLQPAGALSMVTCYLHLLIILLQKLPVASPG